MKTIIDKVIVVEGLDKTGKSTFTNIFETEFFNLQTQGNSTIKKFSFPNSLTPIGKTIRDQLATSSPNPEIVSTPYFLAEMAHFWMVELYELHYKNSMDQSATNNIHPTVDAVTTTNYIFDRYFISTLAYQAFYNNSRADLDFIRTALNTNKFIKLPTDIILFDLPNSIIVERTLADQQNGLVDSNDTVNLEIINKRRDAYVSAIKFLKGMNINIHWFEDVSVFEPRDLAKVLMGKIFR